jgi:phage/plasmid-associated DNA primase
VGAWAGTPGWRFRPGTPGDMISMSTLYDFEEDWATATQWQGEYDEFINKVFKGEEMEHYELVCAWILCGNQNIRRRFLLMPGPGGNSKSLHAKVLKNALGKYAHTMGKMAIQWSGRARGDEEHSTKLAQLKGVRVAITSEPQSKCQYDQDHIKALTGGDGISARPAFGKATDIVTFVPQGSLVQMLNPVSFPEITPDTAFEGRLDVLPMTSVFGKREDKSIIEEDDDEKREYLEDTSLDAKLPHFKHCWLKAALAAYLHFLRNPLFDFQHSKDTLNEMLQRQSAVTAFLAEEVVHVTREVYSGLNMIRRLAQLNMYHTSMDDLWLAFQNWKKQQAVGAFMDDAKKRHEFVKRILVILDGHVKAQNTGISGHFLRTSLYAHGYGITEE